MTQGERVKEIRKMQYDLDAYDKKLLEVYLELPKSARDAIKEIIKKKFGPGE